MTSPKIECAIWATHNDPFIFIVYAHGCMYVLEKFIRIAGYVMITLTALLLVQNETVVYKGLYKYLYVCAL